MTRSCPINGCGAGLRQGYLMCQTHWRMVPKKLQREVHRTWRNFKNGFPCLGEYSDAVKAAIAAIAAEIERSLP